jgi:hypothetical protein
MKGREKKKVMYEFKWDEGEKEVLNEMQWDEREKCHV